MGFSARLTGNCWKFCEKITDAGLAHLAGLTAMKRLWIDSTFEVIGNLLLSPTISFIDRL